MVGQHFIGSIGCIRKRFNLCWVGLEENKVEMEKMEKRREGHEGGGRRVHGGRERQEENEVCWDLIMSLSRKCYISNISAWKQMLSWRVNTNIQKGTH